MEFQVNILRSTFCIHKKSGLRILFLESKDGKLCKISIQHSTRILKMNYVLTSDLHTVFPSYLNSKLLYPDASRMFSFTLLSIKLFLYKSVGSRLHFSRQHFQVRTKEIT